MLFASSVKLSYTRLELRLQFLGAAEIRLAAWSNVVACANLVYSELGKLISRDDFCSVHDDGDDDCSEARLRSCRSSFGYKERGYAIDSSDVRWEHQK